MNPQMRLCKFLKWIGWSRAELGRRIGVNTQQACRIADGSRGVSVSSAVAIEDVTREFGWPEGPILAREWAERSRANGAR